MLEQDGVDELGPLIECTRFAVREQEYGDFPIQQSQFVAHLIAPEVRQDLVHEDGSEFHRSRRRDGSSPLVLTNDTHPQPRQRERSRTCNVTIRGNDQYQAHWQLMLWIEPLWRSALLRRALIVRCHPGRKAHGNQCPTQPRMTEQRRWKSQG
jgi:hypothetical protein